MTSASATPELRRRAFDGLVKFQAALALFIFLPAWSVRFWQAWAYWMLFGACALGITIYFLERDPALIERRLTVGPSAESEPVQQRIQACAAMSVVLMYIVAGLDRHFSWSPPVSTSVVLVADTAVALGFAIIFFAFRANSHAAGVIQVSAGQTVVSSGAYGFVRHPMYSGALILFLSTPVALASVWALLPAIGLAVTLIVRLLDEERFLGAHLAGYDAYQRRVRYRLMPGIW